MRSSVARSIAAVRALLCTALLALAADASARQWPVMSMGSPVEVGLRHGSAQSRGALPAYDLEDGGGKPKRLPRALAEASGLASTADGRLFAHDDERAIVYEIDPATGRAVKSFRLGGHGLRADFEGIEVVGDRFFLVTSTGVLYEFREAADDREARYRAVDTGLSGSCEVEGLAYDDRSQQLLLACKTTGGRALGGRLVVFAVRSGDLALVSSPRFSIPLGFLEHAGHGPNLHPSAIAIHPKSGTVFVLAARERLVVELSRVGAVLGVRALPKSHPQPEGLAFLADGTMLIADERPGGGLLSRYPMTSARRSNQ
jgi:uncharacterized protein YjiK